MIVYLDFETTGLSPLKDHICEFGALAHECSSAFSTVVCPPCLPSPGPMVHGISDDELAQGPAYTEAFARFLSFIENLLNSAVVDLDDSSDEEPDFETLLREDVQLLLFGHNS